MPLNNKTTVLQDSGAVRQWPYRGFGFFLHKGHGSPRKPYPKHYKRSCKVIDTKSLSYQGPDYVPEDLKQVRRSIIRSKQNISNCSQKNNNGLKICLLTRKPVKWRSRTRFVIVQSKS